MKKGTFYIANGLDAAEKANGFLFTKDFLEFGCHCVSRQNWVGTELTTGLKCTILHCRSKEAVEKEVERLFDLIISCLNSKHMEQRRQIFKEQIREAENNEKNL